MNLEQRFADWRETAAILRKTGHVHDAELVEQVLDEFQEAAEDFVTTSAP